MKADAVQRLLVVNGTGNVKHASGTVARWFGLEERFGGGQSPGADEDATGGPTLQDLLPTWWRELGSTYLQVRVGGGAGLMGARKQAPR
jgi:hypothetical protein